jgi:DNA modification methylase
MTQVGDVVVDSFLGSGTTALAAMQLGRRYVGIERDEEYVRLAESRIAALSMERE